MANNGFKAELSEIAAAAGEALQHPTKAAAVVKDKSVAFREASTSTQMTILGGVSAGLTMALQGVRKVQSSLTKDEDGKRQWGVAAVGAAEFLAGGFLTATFYERLKMQDKGCDTGLER